MSQVQQLPDTLQDVFEAPLTMEQLGTAALGVAATFPGEGVGSGWQILLKIVCMLGMFPGSKEHFSFVGG